MKHRSISKHLSVSANTLKENLGWLPLSYFFFPNTWVQHNGHRKYSKDITRISLKSKKASLRSVLYVSNFLSAVKQAYCLQWRQSEACSFRGRHWDYSSCTAVFFKSQLSSNSEEWVAKLSLLSVVCDLEPGNVLCKYFSSHFLFICPSDLQLYFSKESFLSKKLYLVQTEQILNWSWNTLFLPSGHC